MRRVFYRLLFITALLPAGPGYAQQLGPSFWRDECETPWGTTILGGQSVTAYQSATGDACTGCVSETRTCAGNQLSRSYTNQSCNDSALTCVFVTSTTYDGNLGGVTGDSGADGKCTTRAAAAGFPGTFMAWIASDASNDPESRFARSTREYLLPSGTRVANDWTDLTDGTLDAAIAETETGAPPAVSVWTYVKTDGTANVTVGHDNCSAWTTNGSFSAGDKGSPGSTTSTWTNNSNQACGGNGVVAALYCFECAGCP